MTTTPAAVPTDKHKIRRSHLALATSFAAAAVITLAMLLTWVLGNYLGNSAGMCLAPAAAMGLGLKAIAASAPFIGGFAFIAYFAITS